MKNNKTKIILLLATIILITSGCTKHMKNGKENITYDETGQTLTQNILCQPEDEELYNLYKEHEDKMELKLNDLPKCSEFTPNKLKYSGLWEAIFVKPLAWIILQIGELVANMGISVMIVGLLIRLIMIPISKKSALQSENMKKAQPEINKIEKKYESMINNAPSDKLNELTMAKSQETMMVYKKYDINPVSGCIVAFIQLPLFFAFLEAVNRVPAIFEDELWGLRLGMTPFKGLTNGNYIYIILILLIIGSTYLSMKNSMAQASGEAAKQVAFMSKFMMAFIAIASLSLPTAIALYWIVTNSFQFLQSLVVRKLGEKKEDKEKTTKNDKSKVKDAKISKKKR